MRQPFDTHGLWLKAKLFINRANDEDFRSFDEQAMWASLGLELLAKAALAKQSPFLIADPSDDESLILASTLVVSDSRFKSVPAKTLYRRCKRLFPPFDDRKAEQLAHARNEYLHGTGITFEVIPEQVWWADFWTLASHLVAAQDKSIEDLVGDSRQPDVEEYLQLNKKYTEQHCEALINRAKARFNTHKKGTITTADMKAWKSSGVLLAGLRYSAMRSCPACGSDGLVEGEDVQNVRIENFGDDDEGSHYAVGFGDVMADYFSCESCQLVLDSYELLEAASIGDDFEVESEDFVDQYLGESEYGNE
ncbi:hypothetical protein [Specibacter sp. NPDC078709]|uniref:hypothetical protein n=1 Tax=Specibacter sp. NPDC078709 TaxID=3154364 RepID=UPI0034338C99